MYPWQKMNYHIFSGGLHQKLPDKEKKCQDTVLFRRISQETKYNTVVKEQPYHPAHWGCKMCKPGLYSTGHSGVTDFLWFY